MSDEQRTHAISGSLDEELNTRGPLVLAGAFNTKLDCRCVRTFSTIEHPALPRCQLKHMRSDVPTGMRRTAVGSKKPSGTADERRSINIGKRSNDGCGWKGHTRLVGHADSEEAASETYRRITCIPDGVKGQ